jgi:hypothetical protein
VQVETLPRWLLGRGERCPSGLMPIYEGVGQSGLFLTYAMASSRSFWGSMSGRLAVSIIRLASAVRTNEAIAGSASSPSWAHKRLGDHLGLVGIEAGL